MARKAFLAGINQYTCGQNLAGCVADTRAMASVLTSELHFKPEEIRLLTDQSATKKNVIERLRWLLKDSRPGDLLVFHYSGHGSQVVDRDGDELADRRDEILCMHDMDFRDRSTYILDDDLADIFEHITPGARLVVILDCCHSGTATREFALPFGKRSGTPRHAGRGRPRFLPPPDDIAYRFEAQTSKFGSVRLNRIFRNRKEDSDLSHILLSGCRDDQTSADTIIAGKACGAFTYYLTRELRASGGARSYRDIIARVQKNLESNRYSQIPQVSGPDAWKREHAFTAPRAGAWIGARERPPLASIRINGRSAKSEVVTTSILTHGRWIGRPREEDTEGIDDRGILSGCASVDLRLVESRFMTFPKSGELGTPHSPAIYRSQVTIEKQKGHSVLLLENRNGVYSWHAPKITRPTTHRSGGHDTSSHGERVTFELVHPAHPVARRGSNSTRRKMLSDMTDTVLHLFTFPIVEGAKYVLHTTESLLHHEDLSYYTQPSLRKSGAIPVSPGMNPSIAQQKKKAIIFIHGFLSSVESCYGDLPADFLRTLQEHYMLLGFDNLTLSEDPLVNAHSLADRLSALPEERDVTIIAHSRGGLVARAFAEIVNRERRVANVEKIFTFGSPLRGTSLATDVFRLISLLTTANVLLRLTPLVNLCAAAAKFLLSKEVFVGASAMEPRSTLIQRLPRTPALPIYCAESNFEKSISDNLFMKLFDAMADSGIFPGENDLVVDTQNMSPLISRTPRLDFIGSDNISHFDYFRSERTRKFLANFL